MLWKYKLANRHIAIAFTIFLKTKWESIPVSSVCWPRKIKESTKVFPDNFENGFEIESYPFPLNKREIIFISVIQKGLLHAYITHKNEKKF